MKCTTYNIQDDNKIREGLHKFIGKEVIATQKLNAQHWKQQFKNYFYTHA
jgi:hypothetical protein